LAAAIHRSASPVTRHRRQRRSAVGHPDPRLVQQGGDPPAIVRLAVDHKYPGRAHLIIADYSGALRYGKRYGPNPRQHMIFHSEFGRVFT
jgi:hypothetical protein